METNYNSMFSSMPTSCNLDSNAMSNDTQDLMDKSEIKADGGIPPITTKRKLDDSIEASLGTTPTSQSKMK